jgi:hypothetical protein
VCGARAQAEEGAKDQRHGPGSQHDASAALGAAAAAARDAVRANMGVGELDGDVVLAVGAGRDADKADAEADKMAAVDWAAPVSAGAGAVGSAAAQTAIAELGEHSLTNRAADVAAAQADKDALAAGKAEMGAAREGASSNADAKRAEEYAREAAAAGSMVATTSRFPGTGGVPFK